MRRDARLASILVVEDDTIIGMAIEGQLTDFGYKVLGPSVSVASALIELARQQPTAALLDVMLNDQVATPVAKELLGRGVPFALLTVLDDSELDPEMLDLPRLAKPFTDKDLKQLMLRLLGAGE